MAPSNDNVISINALVTHLKWVPNRHGILVPVVYFTPASYVHPISKQYTIIDHVSGYNANFIANNKIDQGSIIEIKASKDVIPHISRIIQL